jgi:hypothetical protein
VAFELDRKRAAVVSFKRQHKTSIMQLNSSHLPGLAYHLSRPRLMSAISLQPVMRA